MAMENYSLIIKTILKDNLSMADVLVMVGLLELMVATIKAILRIMRLMDTVFLLEQMGTDMRANGKAICQMDQGMSHIRMEIDMLDSS